MITPGLTGSASYDVSADRTTGHVGRGVLATPSMIGLIEWTCFDVTAGLVAEGETTVGIHVCVSHEAVVVEGEAITIDVELQAVEGRRLTFGIEVLGPRGRVSTGTHQRAVVTLPS